MRTSTLIHLLESIPLLLKKKRCCQSIKIYLTAFLFCFSFIRANGQKNEIVFDYSSVEKFIEVIEKGQVLDNDFKDLVSMKGTQAYLKKMAGFFPNINESNFRQSLQLAVEGKPSKGDQFRFHKVLESLPNAKKLLRTIKKRENEIIQKFEFLLSNYIPSNVEMDVDVYLLLGVVGGGWTFDDDPNSFYVDITSIQGDIEGLVYLCAHELYHVAQNKFMTAKPNKTNKAAYLIEETVREGSASYVADFSKLTSIDTYVDFNRTNYKKNLSRIKSNFELFEALVNHASSNKDANVDLLYDIGFNGTYQSPLYFVGYHIIKLIEKYKGRKALLEMLTKRPEKLMLEYDRLCKKYREKDIDFIPLSNRTLEILAMLIN